MVIVLTLYGKPDVILQYYRSLKQNIDKKNYSAFLSGDLNSSSFDWERCVILSNRHFYSQLKSVAIYTTTYILVNVFICRL
jgi:hypothetical protein